MQVVLDVAVGVEDQGLGGAVGLDAMRCQGVEPGDPVGTGERKNRAVIQSHPALTAGQALLLGERIAEMGHAGYNAPGVPVCFLFI